ncbi:MAG: branched-chain amino acid transporter AzlD [Ruminococcaceae bacterium]|nr:branched-chain amino acid transporter AzlD [Oscillospiraceae bacterium]
MTHSPWQVVVVILMVALGAQLTRWLPFLLFPENRKAPKFITALGKILPPAVIGLLVVYCFKSVSLVSPPHGLPEAIAVAVVALLHIKWKNSLLSIGAGTAVYILLIRLVFA